MTLDDIKNRVADQNRKFDEAAEELRAILSEQIEGIGLNKARDTADALNSALEYVESASRQFEIILDEYEPEEEVDEEEVAF
jgi:hypothetical protein